MKSTFIVSLLCFTFIFTAPFLYAEEGKDSKQLFYESLKPLMNAESYEVEGKIIYTLNPEKANQKSSEVQQKFKVVSKGDKLNFVLLNTPQGNIQIFRNGTDLTIYSESEKKYLERQAPENVGLFMLIGLSNLYDSIIYGDPNVVPSLQIQQVESAPEEKENQFQIKTDKGDEIYMWLTKGNKPQLTRMQTTIPDSSMSSGGVLRVYFDNWKLNSVSDESVFKFNPPAGVSKIERKKDEAVGQKAPEFTLSTLDGKTVSLKDFRDKKVVVLDFWASWCGPCRMAMPIIQEVSEELKDKDVIFFAVNIAEEKEKVTNFVNKMGIKLNILLDADGRVATQYRVESIPRMFIIGKDGIIKAGHSGFAMSMKEELKKEILEALK